LSASRLRLDYAIADGHSFSSPFSFIFSSPPMLATTHRAREAAREWRRDARAA